MLFDYYEIRARLIPAAVVASPAILPALATGITGTDGWMWTSVAATVVLMLIYVFSFVVRLMGKRIEPALWASWGGPPSTLLVGSSDTTFPTSTKTRIYEAVRQEAQIDIDSANGNDAEWRERSWEAFRLVRQFLRQRDPNGLWFTHDAEYGGLRNLLGSAVLMASIAGASAAICAAMCWHHASALRVVLCMAAIALGGLALASRRYVLPEIVRSAAFRYAESAWLSYLSTCANKGEPRVAGEAR